MIKIMRNVILIFLLTINAWSSPDNYMLSSGSETKTIDFLSALELGLAHNLELKKSALSLPLKESEKAMALSKIAPTLSANLGFEERIGRDISKSSEARTAFSATVPLFDAKAFLSLRSKHEGLAAAQKKYRLQEEELLQEIGSNYIEALIAQAIQEIAGEEREQFDRQLRVIRKKLELGEARSLDVTRAEYLVHKAQSDYLAKEEDALKKLGSLGELIGEKENFVLSALKIESPHFSLDKTALLAMAETALDMDQARSDLKASRYSLLGERLDFLPKISASSESWLMPNKAWSANFMLNINLPLFSGGATMALIKEQSTLKQIKELELRQKSRQKTLTINSLLEQIARFDMSAQSGELALKSAAQVKESAERLFAQGAATALELIEANISLFAAKNHLATTMLRREQAKLKLLFSIGRIKDII